MYDGLEISSIPLSLGACRTQVEMFLAKNGLRLDPVDLYLGVYDADGENILAGGGLKDGVIKCLAVSESLRGTDVASRIVSALISEAAARGYASAKVYTKPSNQKIFSNLGFNTIAASPKAVLMENGHGLAGHIQDLGRQRKPGKNGAIVMNANPFTLGHRYLIEQSAGMVDWLYVLVVKEDRQRFSYRERLDMVRKGTRDIGNVIVCEGSDYTISRLTFPTYFLKEESEATDSQIALDLDLFSHKIAPALGVSIRFTGTEPTDGLTAKYNRTMSQELPKAGIEVREIPRLELGGQVVSASRVRAALDKGSFAEASGMVHEASRPYLLADLARISLDEELELTPKPGLVDKEGNGAHNDMNISLMRKSIEAIRPYFGELASIGWEMSSGDKNPDPAPLSKTISPIRETGINANAVAGAMASQIKAIGLAAENAMFAVTGGINTHKGAVFALGLTLAASASILRRHGRIDSQTLQDRIAELAAGFTPATGTHGTQAVESHGLKGALAMAQEGYAQVFRKWLPEYRKDRNRLRLLLLIISTLDDTNIAHRAGIERLRKAQQAAAETWENFAEDAVRELGRSFIKDNISPGGSADMLALTLFIDKILPIS